MPAKIANNDSFKTKVVAQMNSRKRMISHKEFSDRELKYAPVALESVSDEGVFCGYASLFNTVDLGRDSVAKGAFAKCLKRVKPLSIKLLYQHNPAEPIGIWERIYEDHKGLYVQGRLLPDISRGRDVLSLMRKGALDGLSIGFKTLRSRPIKKGAVRLILELDLYEISVVTFPMHPDARVQMVKSLPMVNGLPTIRDFERWLMRDAGFTRRQAQTAIAKGFKSLLLKRDVEGVQNSTDKTGLSPPPVLAKKLRHAALSFTNDRG